MTKAQDLNTAASWVLGRNEADIPELLKSAVISLRNAIGKDEITTLYFWYQHNCDEIQDIQNEMNTVTTTANALLKQHFPGKQINIIGTEVGNQTLEKWYINTTNRILVSDDIETPLPYGGFEIKEKIGHHIKLISVEQSYIICTGVIMTIYFRQILEDSLALAEKPMSSIWE